MSSREQSSPDEAAGLRFDPAGLIPAVVQDSASGEVLMVAWMNRESLARTLETGHAWFWSRSRGRLWHKGEESGAIQEVEEVMADCDQDTLLVRVRAAGPACHTGRPTCFFRRVERAEGSLLRLAAQAAGAGFPAHRLWRAVTGLQQVIRERQQQLPEGSYTSYLFQSGLDKILKKIGEEASEVVIAAKNDEQEALVGELSDLIYHLLVLAAERGVGAGQLADKLESRRK